MWTKMNEDGDRYARANNKWAKIHKMHGGGYLVVKGWKSDFKGQNTQRTPSFAHARIIGENWIND